MPDVDEPDDMYVYVEELCSGTEASDKLREEAERIHDQIRSKNEQELFDYNDLMGDVARSYVGGRAWERSAFEQALVMTDEKRKREAPPEEVAEAIAREEEHTVMITVAMKSFGHDDQVLQLINDVKAKLSVIMHRDVEVVAFGYTARGSLITQNGTLDMAELLKQYEDIGVDTGKSGEVSAD